MLAPPREYKKLNAHYLFELILLVMTGRSIDACPVDLRIVPYM